MELPLSNCCRCGLFQQNNNGLTEEWCIVYKVQDSRLIDALLWQAHRGVCVRACVTVVHIRMPSSWCLLSGIHNMHILVSAYLQHRSPFSLVLSHAWEGRLCWAQLKFSSKVRGERDILDVYTAQLVWLFFLCGLKKRRFCNPVCPESSITVGTRSLSECRIRNYAESASEVWHSSTSDCRSWAAFSSLTNISAFASSS